jgi:hypothetical protein
LVAWGLDGRLIDKYKEFEPYKKSYKFDEESYSKDRHKLDLVHFIVSLLIVFFSYALST